MDQNGHRQEKYGRPDDAMSKTMTMKSKQDNT